MTNTSTGNITLLPVNQLRPNAWNPNQMTDIEFRELVEEVRRLGRVPKPIVVRRHGEQFEIVDGEHNWRAAQEIGQTDLPCEIIEADDFEAMLQTYKRNQHGQHSPVLEGRLFRDMCERREVSARELARLAGISEGTIRNRLRYAQAADVRNGYAGENRDVEVDGLQVRQVRAYVDLPHPIGDLWLDAGGELGLIGKYIDQDIFYLGKLLERYDLIEFLDPQDFRGSFARIAALAEWLDYHQHVRCAVEYARPIAELQLPALLAAAIPVSQSPHDRDVHIDLESWLELVDEISGRQGTPEDLILELASAVYERLEDLDVDPRQVYDDGVLVGHIETLLETPDYIREAHRLTLEERGQLHFATAPAPPDIIDRAKRETVAVLSEERSVALAGGGQHPSGPAYVLGVFLGKVRKLLEADGHVIEPRHFDREELLQSFDGVFDYCPQLRDATVAGRPASELFRDRIADLATPELITMRVLFDGAIPSLALGYWMDAVHAEVNSENADEGTVQSSSDATQSE